LFLKFPFLPPLALFFIFFCCFAFALSLPLNSLYYLFCYVKCFILYLLYIFFIFILIFSIYNYINLIIKSQAYFIYIFFVVTVWDALPELTGNKAFLFWRGWLAPTPIFCKIERFWMFGAYFRIVIKD